MINEYKLDTENLKEQIKYLAALQGLTMVGLKEKVNEKFGKSDSVRNLGNKLRNKTFRISELNEIMEVLNYELVLRKLP